MGSAANKEILMQVTFSKYKCELEFRKYHNGRVMIQLNDAQDGEPVAAATVNLAESQIEDDEVIIKDWSENEGMLKCLEEAGVVKFTGHRIATGFVKAHVCKLLRTD